MQTTEGNLEFHIKINTILILYIVSHFPVPRVSCLSCDGLGANKNLREDGILWFAILLKEEFKRIIFNM